MGLLAYSGRRKSMPMPSATPARAFSLPAPIGGMDTVSSGTAMPAAKSILSYNLIGAEYGLRTRLGYREWVTGLDADPQSVLPFSGSFKNGSSDRLFACTISGVWDCSASTDAPTRSVTFGTQNGDSGYGISTAFTDLNGGHWLCYTDEANGYYVYSEANATWTKVVPAATNAWAGTTGYTVGQYVLNGGLTYICTQSGTSAGSGGPTGTGTNISDGTCKWSWVPAIGGVDPAKFCFVMPWKNRLWFIERDTQRAWYLDIGALYGTAHSFMFGSRFKAGGDLRGLYSWTIDGGSGTDDRLVALSGGGDVVIYAGTDPSSASTFALVGVWNVGAVPAGRRIATDNGGDLLIMSSLGIQSIAKLVIGNPVYDRSQYQTADIANLFNQLQASTSTVRGWAMAIHPLDAALIVLIPQAANQPTNQLAMSLITKGWHQYRGLPMGVCAASWSGTLFFGSGDGSGRLLANDGYVDGLTLADPNTFSPIDWSLLTAYSNLGSPAMKRLQTIAVRVLSQGGVSLNAEARVGFDMSEAASASTPSSAEGNTWDAGLWDAATWSGSYQPKRQVFGAFGMAPELAVAVRGKSTSRMALVGVDVTYDVGGAL